MALYLNPPDNAVVFSFDEKSSVQALDRTQPGLPLKPGRCGTMTHDYKRHGTTSLFAAMDVASGEVIGETYRRHRHQELLRFLRKVEKEVPKGREIHIILDNYSTHKHGKVREWAEGTKRVHFHFVPTSSSWLNLVERFFSTLTQKRIRRGVFHSVPHLESCLKQYIQTYNENPRPFERRSYREPRAASSLIAAALSCAACASRRITSTVSSPAIVPASPSNSSQSIPYATACAAPLSVLTTIRLPTASADTKSVGRIVSNGAMFSHSSGSV